jgi:hypothetical protein
MHPVQLFELVFIMLLAILVLHWIAPRRSCSYSRLRTTLPPTGPLPVGFTAGVNPHYFFRGHQCRKPDTYAAALSFGTRASSPIVLVGRCPDRSGRPT